MSPIASEFLGDSLVNFRRYKQMGEKAMAQVEEADLGRALDEEGNSIAIIVQHLRGNMLSRWRDFLTTDGEKPDRDRDSEFVGSPAVDRAALEAQWEAGWAALFGAMEALRPTDLERVVTIRGEPHSVLQAILRQLTHASYHVGQIVFLAKHFRGEEWQTLSIPRKR